MLFSLSISLRSHTFRIRSYTFRRGFRHDLWIPHTFLYVLSNPYAVPEKCVLKSYVPIRSVQPSHKFEETCTQIIRSYTFWATLSQFLPDLIRSFTFRLRSFTFCRWIWKNISFFIRSFKFRATVSQKLIRQNTYDRLFDSIANKCRGVKCTHPYMKMMFK